MNKGSIDGLRRCPRLQFDLGEAEDLKLYSEALPVLAQNGARIRLSWCTRNCASPRPGLMSRCSVRLPLCLPLLRRKKRVLPWPH